METRVHLARERHRFATAEDFDSLLCLVHNQGAVFAMLQMAFEFLPDGWVKITVDKV